MKGSIRILCVDDDPDILAITAMSLGLDAGIEVRSTASGAEALATLAGWWPDAVLLDVMMPGTDGPAVLVAIRALEGGARLPVIFMTARARKADLEAYGASGAGVIVKPFDPLRLADEVRALVGGRR